MIMTSQQELRTPEEVIAGALRAVMLVLPERTWRQMADALIRALGLAGFEIVDALNGDDLEPLGDGETYVQIAVRVPKLLLNDRNLRGLIAEAAQDFVNETYA
jgi:hypothetical protein